MATIHVERPGPCTTVQDPGRLGFAAIGVSRSGAADPLSLRLGNALVGNPPGAAALEMTLGGGTFRFDAGAVVALTGSPFETSIEDAAGERRAIPGWRSVEIGAGERLVVGATRGGARAYLCVSGGIEVPPVLGSASTHLASGIGGIEGRALKSGDRLTTGASRAAAAKALGPGEIAALDAILGRRTLRVVDGAHAERFEGEPAKRFLGTVWSVSEQSDRMGIRLVGAALAPSSPGTMTTEGMPIGAIQVPGDGQPIVLFVEHQTTGGYPVIACVIAADLPALAHLRPRDALRFDRVSLADARVRLAEQEVFLQAIEAGP